jgi:hypothetical protein
MVCETLSRKKTLHRKGLVWLKVEALSSSTGTKKDNFFLGAGGVVHVVKHLHSKCEAQSSTIHTARERERIFSCL